MQEQDTNHHKHKDSQDPHENSIGEMLIAFGTEHLYVNTVTLILTTCPTPKFD